MNNWHNIYHSGECPSQAELVAYANGQLDRANQHRIERHTLDCDACADTIEGLVMLAEQGTDVAGVITILQDKVNAPEESNKRGGFFWWGIAASVVVLLSIGGFWMTQSLNDDALAENKPQHTEEAEETPSEDESLVEQPPTATEDADSEDINQQEEEVNKPPSPALEEKRYKAASEPEPMPVAVETPTEAEVTPDEYFFSHDLSDAEEPLEEVADADFDRRQQGRDKETATVDDRLEKALKDNKNELNEGSKYADNRLGEARKIKETEMELALESDETNSVEKLEEVTITAYKESLQLIEPNFKANSATGDGGTILKADSVGRYSNLAFSNAEPQTVAPIIPKSIALLPPPQQLEEESAPAPTNSGGIANSPTAATEGNDEISVVTISETKSRTLNSVAVSSRSNAAGKLKQEALPRNFTQREKADLHFEQLEYAEALKLYEKVLSKKNKTPDHSRAMLNAAICYYSLNRHEQAIDLLDQLTLYDNFVPFPLVKKQEDKSGSLQDPAPIVNRHPYWEEIGYYKAKSLIGLGQKESAKTILKGIEANGTKFSLLAKSLLSTLE